MADITPPKGAYVRSLFYSVVHFPIKEIAIQLYKFQRVANVTGK